MSVRVRFPFRVLSHQKTSKQKKLRSLIVSDLVKSVTIFRLLFGCFLLLFVAILLLAIWLFQFGGVCIERSKTLFMKNNTNQGAHRHPHDFYKQCTAEYPPKDIVMVGRE